VNNVEEPREDDEVVRRDVGGWLSGSSLDPASAEAADLAELQARFPRWTLWKGHATGRYWAAPPSSMPRALIDAGTLGELALMILDIETWAGS
jgi:hypothetical protein